MNKFLMAIFIVAISKPFTKWKAFDIGLIDDKGKLLKKPSTIEEKKALPTIKDFARRIKIIILKFTPDNNFLKFLILGTLLKSESTEYKNFNEELNEKLTKDEIDQLTNILNNIKDVLPGSDKIVDDNFWELS